MTTGDGRRVAIVTGAAHGIGRAIAVRDHLKAQGIAEDRFDLVKPVVTEGSGNEAEARRFANVSSFVERMTSSATAEYTRPR